jgi:hypothetical protein
VPSGACTPEIVLSVEMHVAPPPIRSIAASSPFARPVRASTWAIAPASSRREWFMGRSFPHLAASHMDAT